MFKKTSLRRYKFLFGAVALVFLILISFFVYFYFYRPTREKNGNHQTASECELRRKIDGVCATPEGINLWPVAVMIDNYPDARPLFGLSQAQLVYNTLAEGGSTRLMAIFAGEEKIEKIGPVRSARPYYLPWAKELNALYGHSGGSPEAITKIKEDKIIDWEEATAYGPQYFWRDKNLASPHNLFTASEKISAARNDWELSDKEPLYYGWQFSISASSTSQSAKEIAIDYSTLDIFNVSYQYNPTSQNYLRWQGREPFLDGLDKKQVAVKNLIIQFVPEEIHLDKEDRLRIEVTGTGAALIFYHGQMAKGKWVKDNLSSRTVFYDENNREIIFPPGNIWVEVVPGERTVEIKP